MTRRRRASAAGAETISAKDFAAVQRAAVRKAKAGVVGAMNLVDSMRRRDRRVALDLPPITGAESLAEAHARVIDAAASGRITAQEALAFSTLLERRRRALDTVISERTLVELNVANSESAAEPEPSTLRPADAAFRSVKKHGHRTLALKAAAKMEARALEAGAQAPPAAGAQAPLAAGAQARNADNPQAKPETTPTTSDVDAKLSGPIETEPAPPPPGPDPGTLWREEHCRWRPLGERDDHEYDRQDYGTDDDDDPVDDP